MRARGGLDLMSGVSTDECPEQLRPMHTGGLEAGTAAYLELMNDARQAAGLSTPSSVL